MAQGMTSGAEGEAQVNIDGIEIATSLGRGGMGEVYLGRQVRLDREVAVKVLARELARDPLFIERLEREARVMAQLRHPNIVTVHDFHRAGDTAAIVMELVEGGTLREKLRDHPRGMTVEEALSIIRQIAAGLETAHAAGMIHRDMKPENVLIAPSGTVMVSDFGLALPLHDETARLTLTGTAMGTVDYMAPEQFRAARVDIRIDIYALGVIAYELLTGRTPRGSFDAPHLIRKDIPLTVSLAIMRALRPKAEERFASVAEFMAALHAPAKNPALGWLMVSAGLAVLALASWFVFAPKPGPEPGPWRDASAGMRIWQDVVRGVWENNNGVLTSGQDINIAQLEAEMPESYDVRMRFSRLKGKYSVALFFRSDGGTGSAEVDAWTEGLAGVQEIDDHDLTAGYGFRFPLTNGESHEMLLEVRPHVVRMSLDGQLKKTFATKDKTLTVSPAWEWDPVKRPMALGIGSYKSSTRFDSVEWRAVPPEAK